MRRSRYAIHVNGPEFAGRTPEYLDPMRSCPDWPYVLTVHKTTDLNTHREFQRTMNSAPPTAIGHTKKDTEKIAEFIKPDIAFCRDDIRQKEAA